MSFSIFTTSWLWGSQKLYVEIKLAASIENIISELQKESVDEIEIRMSLTHEDFSRFASALMENRSADELIFTASITPSHAILLATALKMNSTLKKISILNCRLIDLVIDAFVSALTRAKEANRGILGLQILTFEQDEISKKASAKLDELQKCYPHLKINYTCLKTPPLSPQNSPQDTKTPPSP